MAHLQDLWEKSVDGSRVRTARYGKGNRWQARYVDIEGAEHTRTFARKQDAARFLATVTADLMRGSIWTQEPARSPSPSLEAVAQRPDLR